MLFLGTAAVGLNYRGDSEFVLPARAGLSRVCTAASLSTEVAHDAGKSRRALCVRDVALHGREHRWLRDRVLVGVIATETTLL